MSRGYGERRAAWETWVQLHRQENGAKPAAYRHHCGAVTDLSGDLGEVICSGCGFELSRPEECEPLYSPSMSELERLRAWKAEATEVLKEWDEVWEIAGKPGLGQSKARAVGALLLSLKATDGEG